VGRAYVGGAWHASLWSGTAGSWVDLNPAGASASNAWGVSGPLHVGGAVFSGFQRAGVWSGSAASWVDLHAFLPSGFTHSVAKAISTDGSNYYIAGAGRNSANGRDEAVLWIQPVPAPGAITLLGLGGLLAGRRRR